MSQLQKQRKMDFLKTILDVLIVFD